jgi:hypothetical protein
MAFVAGQRVVLMVRQVYADGRFIEWGTKGTVTRPAPTLKSSWIEFDATPGEKLVPDSNLESVAA